LCRKEGFGWLTEQEVLGRMEGFRAVDGMEGSGLDERVFGRKEGSRCRERDCGGSAREEREDLDGVLESNSVIDKKRAIRARRARTSIRLE
jgi:hypothetical protein